MDNFVAIDFETANFAQSSVCSVGLVIAAMRLETSYTRWATRISWSCKAVWKHGKRQARLFRLRLYECDEFRTPNGMSVKQHAW